MTGSCPPVPSNSSCSVSTTTPSWSARWAQEEDFLWGCSSLGFTSTAHGGFAGIKHKNWGGTPSSPFQPRTCTKFPVQEMAILAVLQRDMCKSVNCEDVGWAESLFISEFFCRISFADGCFSHLQFVIWREPSMYFFVLLLPQWGSKQTFFPPKNYWNNIIYTKLLVRVFWPVK